MDFIENVSPFDTPLFNNLSQVKVNAGFTEYLEDDLVAAEHNAFVEAGAATDPALEVPGRNASIVQNFQRHWQVSRRQQAVRHAGFSSADAYQEMKAAKRWKTDVELALHRGSAVSGTNSVAPQFGGMLNKLSTNFTSSSGTTLTEKVYNDIVTLGYNFNLNYREVYANMFIKRTISNFSTNVQRFVPAGDKKQLNVIDVYESEQGLQAVIKSRYQLIASNFTSAGNSWIAIDPDKFNVGILRPLTSYELGLDGDRIRRYMVGELTLIVRSEKGGAGGVGHVANIPL